MTKPLAIGKNDDLLWQKPWCFEHFGDSRNVSQHGRRALQFWMWRLVWFVLYGNQDPVKVKLVFHSWHMILGKWLSVKTSQTSTPSVTFVVDEDAWGSKNCCFPRDATSTQLRAVSFFSAKHKQNSYSKNYTIVKVDGATPKRWLSKGPW